MPTGYTTVSGAKLTDSTGTAITNATIFFQPCNNGGVPISFCVNGAGQATDLPVSTQVTAGAFTLQLADTSLTDPLNIGYLVTVVDNLSNKQLLGPGYIIQPHGATWSFDTFVPNLGTMVAIQVGAQGPQGIPGQVSYATLSAIAQRAVAVNTPVGANLFDLGKVTPGAVLLATGVIRQDSTVLGWDLSDFIFCFGFGTMVANVPLGVSTTLFGSVCFYDSTFTFISAITGIVAAGSAIAVPATAVFMRTFVPVLPSSAAATLVNITTMGIYSGSTLPATFAAFGFATPGQLPVLVGEAVAQVAAKGPAAVNLFSVARSTTPGVILPTGALSTSYPGFTATDFIPVFGLSQVVSNAALLYVAGVAATCFYDQNYVFLSSLTAIVAAGVPLAIPAGAYFMRAYVAVASSSGISTLVNTATMMIVAGPALPSSYVAFGYVTADQLTAAGYATPALAGKRLGIFGDSYTGKAAFAGVWQSVVLNNNRMTQTFQDAISGRPFSGIFSHYGGGAGAGTCDTSGISNAAETTFGCTVGQTLAGALADVDICIVELGTNDNATTLGAVGDSVSTASLYGYVRNAITSILTANPAIRLLMVGPNYNSQGPLASIQAVDTCISTVAASFGVPYLSMLKVSGVNALTAASLLLSDGVHPTQAFFGGTWGRTVASFVGHS